MNTKINTGTTGSPAVTMAEVQSSNVAAIGYLPSDKATGALFVRFVGGAIYRYEGVPPHVHAALMASESKGKYVAAHVRGAYPFARL